MLFHLESNSGGIISLWNKSNSRLIFSFFDEGFVGVCLEWEDQNQRCIIINVYSKCDFVAKRRLLEHLFGDEDDIRGGSLVYCC